MTIVECYFQTQQFILKIYNRFWFLIQRLNDSSKLKLDIPPDFISLKEDLIKELQEYKTFLFQLKILIPQTFKENNIRKIDEICNEVKNNGLDEYKLSFHIISILMINRDLAQLISSEVNNKIINYFEIEQKINKGFNEEVKSIMDFYSTIITSSRGTEKDFLEASHASFKYGLYRFNCIFSSLIKIIPKTDDLVNLDVYSSLVSSLFLLLSAYDKLIVSMGYKRGLDINLKCYPKEVLEEDDKSNNPKKLREIIEVSDRYEIIKVAKNLRNMNTHRIGNLLMGEIKGYSVSIIKEILRLLQTYQNI